ncbi:putative quinol monooxygenase [Parasphingorhabdus sp.]|uniref:putative quinol monooxygenase n=1 Tax=Parasphingorhabdus sp. TaxID=2709688 RepID=UPI002F94CF16
MSKILIAAHIDVEPAQRDACLKTAQPYIDGALSQNGCLRYSWAADLNLPGRILVFEEWTDEDSLARHFKGDHYSGMRDHIADFGLIDSTSAKYRVDAESPVYNADGLPTPAFG